MTLWELVLDSVGVLLGLIIFYGIALVSRRRWLSRNGGTFELSYRLRTNNPGHGWLLGIGRYSGESVDFFRIFSLALRPRRSWRRSELRYLGKRNPEGAESISLYAGHVVVMCEATNGPVELAMSESSLTGFTSWLESAPGGHPGAM